MGVLRLVFGLFRGVQFLIQAVIVLVITVAGWLLVGDMVNSGRLPPEPLGLAEMGFPETLFGLPTAYAAGILLVAGLLLFGEGGSGSTSGGGFADGGGGDGGGGNGGGE